MDKILIEIEVPAAGISYDIFVPLNMQVGTLVQLAGSAFTKLSDGGYRATAETVLCDQRSGIVYDENKRIYETDMKNGTKLYLM